MSGMALMHMIMFRKRENHGVSRGIAGCEDIEIFSCRRTISSPTISSQPPSPIRVKKAYQINLGLPTKYFDVGLKLNYNNWLANNAARYWFGSFKNSPLNHCEEAKGRRRNIMDYLIFTRLPPLVRNENALFFKGFRHFGTYIAFVSFRCGCRKTGFFREITMNPCKKY